MRRDGLARTSRPSSAAIASGWIAAQPGRVLIGAAKAAAVVAIVIWSLFPIAFIVVSSFKSGQDIFAVPPQLLFSPTWHHYGQLWTRWGTFFDGLLNSTLVTIGATVLAVTLSTCAGYAYSRYSSRFLNA